MRTFILTAVFRLQKSIYQEVDRGLFLAEEWKEQEPFQLPPPECTGGPQIEIDFCMRQEFRVVTTTMAMCAMVSPITMMLGRDMTCT